MINAVETMLIAKLIRNTTMAPTTKLLFVREMIKIIKNNSPWFKEKDFKAVALYGLPVPDKMIDYYVKQKEKKNEV